LFLSIFDFPERRHTAIIRLYSTLFSASFPGPKVY